MDRLCLRRTVTKSLFRLSLRLLSTTESLLDSPSPAKVPEEHPPAPSPHTPRQRGRTPSEKQFETWIDILKPGFTPIEVNEALRSQTDPDLALDIFRWTAQQRYYKHNHITYLTMIELAISGKRYSITETLIEEVLSGACSANLPLYNTMIKFCCGRKLLFNRAFDVYKKMLKSEDAQPNLETYSLLFNSLLRKFDKITVCYVYMPSVRSLAKQMKACGVIPDTFVLNMIIKAYSKCHEIDEAVRVFHEMGLYGCEPNAFTYSYLTKGACEKGRVNQGYGFFREMREKGLLPNKTSWLVLICSLAMDRRYEDAVETTMDMLVNSISPDLLTYKTLVEEMCRDGRGEEALELVEMFRKKDTYMNEKTYRALLDAVQLPDHDL